MENMTLHVSDIQHFSVGDGPGIRTTVFLMGCPLKCPWCHNPETRQASHTIAGGSRRMTLREILAAVMEDADFYAASGGGLTLSGGEAMCQPEGASALAKMAKEAGISVCIDTAGDVPWAHFERTNPHTDCYLYDVKTADPAKSLAVTGGDLARITENLRRLIAAGKTVRARIPLIPGFNLDGASLEALVVLLRDAGVTTVDLLPFHRLGYEKYLTLGQPYTMKDVLPPAMSEIEAAAAHFRPYFDVTIEK